MFSNGPILFNQHQVRDCMYVSQIFVSQPINAFNTDLISSNIKFLNHIKSSITDI